MKRTIHYVLVVIALSVTAHAATIGETAPSFSAKNQDGKLITSDGLKGRPVLLYFYPKDDTPGCTVEAQQFRDEYTAFTARGIVVLGVSKQDEKSHQDFRAKHKLPFDLLVDEGGKLAQAFGVGSMPIIGLFQRQSVLIDAKGKIVKFYSSVDPKTHAREVLKDLPQ